MKKCFLMILVSLLVASCVSVDNHSQQESVQWRQYDELESANRHHRQKNYAQALAIYTKLANEGNPSAQNNLGLMYAKGQGVPQDYQKAVEWYTKATNQGDADAQNNLGSMYYHGRGVPQDDQKAVEWYTKAANQGPAVAQHNLGFMYLHGRAVSKDPAKAQTLWQKACQQGHKGSCAAQKSLDLDVK